MADVAEDRVIAALDALDRAHNAYALAALRGAPSVDRARSVLIETRAQLREEFGAPAPTSGETS